MYCLGNIQECRKDPQEARPLVSNELPVARAARAAPTPPATTPKSHDQLRRQGVHQVPHPPPRYRSLSPDSRHAASVRSLPLTLVYPPQAHAASSRCTAALLDRRLVGSAAPRIARCCYRHRRRPPQLRRNCCRRWRRHRPPQVSAAAAGGGLLDAGADVQPRVASVRQQIGRLQHLF